MQNSLFTLNPVTDSDRGTDSDVVFGKTYGKTPHKGFTEKPVTTCPSVTNRAEAVLLKANLERRGVLLLAENGAIVCDGDSVVIDRFAMDIVRLKPALIQLLNTPNESAPVAHRWASATDVAASSPTVSAAAATPIHSRDNDLRAIALLAKYRREGAVVELEEIEVDGEAWSALACDLSAMPAAKREGRYLAIEQNARLFQRALELERRANQPQSAND